MDLMVLTKLKRDGGNMRVKYDYKILKEMVESKGYILLDKDFININTTINIMDELGYKYQTQAKTIQKSNPKKFDVRNKYTLDNIKLWLSYNSDLILLSDKYVRNIKPLIFTDAYGYMYECSLVLILSIKNKPEICSAHNPYSIHNMKLWCQLNNKSFELLSEKYINSTTTLNFKCLKEKCKEEFTLSWDKISQGSGCPYCSGKRVGISNSIKTTAPKVSEEWHTVKNGDLTPNDVVSGSKKRVWWMCRNGHEWEAQVYNRINNKSNCPYCTSKRPSKEYNFLIINKELTKEWNYIKNHKQPDEFLPVSQRLVWWVCSKCTHEWEATIANRVKGMTGCPKCTESKGQSKISNIFHNKNIEYKEQQTFDCLKGVGGGNLSYDFFLPKYNLLIEYNGEQHYKPIVFFGGEEQFKKQQEHDKRKREYADENKIKLLEIPYWDFENIEDILNKELMISKTAIGL